MNQTTPIHEKFPFHAKDITLYVAHHDCDVDHHMTTGKCANIIFKLDLFKTEKRGIFAVETIVEDDSVASQGQLWGLDYSFRENRLFLTDIQRQTLR